MDGIETVFLLLGVVLGVFCGSTVGAFFCCLAGVGVFLAAWLSSRIVSVRNPELTLLSELGSGLAFLLLEP